jgi:hypothetical protein
MEINGIIRVNMTGAEIEAALLKAKDLPTATELQEKFDAKQDTLEFATDEDIEREFGDTTSENGTE